MPDARRLNPLESPPPPFACGRCHRVTNLSRADGNGWNELVTPPSPPACSTDVRCGREVPKSGEWTCGRNTKHKRSHARPAGRRAEVCRLLTETSLTRPELATHLGLSRGTIKMHVEDVFDQYGVHSREALRERPRRVVETRVVQARNIA